MRRSNLGHMQLQPEIVATPAGNSADIDVSVVYRYWAFISYSHHDEKWARWLHRELETYGVPKRLVGRPAAGGGSIGERILPVFRDRDELIGGFDLNERIRVALQQSRFLIVICSPRAVASAHVQQEIETFEALGREERVLCLIVDGEPNASDHRSCLPVPVRTRISVDGTLVPCEPIAADVRTGKDGRANSLLKILANMLGVGFDDLRQREQQRKFIRTMKISVLAAMLGVIATMGYLLVLDLGTHMPGGEAFRTLLDRHRLSLLRPVYSEAVIREAAHSMRTRLSNRLHNARLATGWYAQSFNTADNETGDAWIHSQTAVALLSAPEADTKLVQSVAAALKLPFENGVAIESQGVKYGWLAREGERNTISVPGLWAIMGTAVAIRKGAYVSSQAREIARRHAAYAEETLTLYNPSTTGGWNLFPNQQDVSRHNAYVTALALMALLEMRRAEMSWRGSGASRDHLIRKGFAWLIESFNEATVPAGWQAGSESMSATADGLTLQIYGRLLDAASELDLEIPQAISREMVHHLVSLGQRTMEFPISSGEFATRIADHRGDQYIARESINFPWYPWAVDCAARWLRSENARLAAPEDRVAVERSLGHLIVELGPEAVAAAERGWTFVAAEALYGLSAIPPGAQKAER
jgi:MTH538 TIR-like domain (DUF1863)